MFTVKFCFIQHHDNFIPKKIAVLRLRTRFIRAVDGPSSQEIGFVEQKLADKTNNAKLLINDTLRSNERFRAFHWTGKYVTKTVMWRESIDAFFSLTKTDTFERH